MIFRSNRFNINKKLNFTELPRKEKVSFVQKHEKIVSGLLKIWKFKKENFSNPSKALFTFEIILLVKQLHGAPPQMGLQQIYIMNPILTELQKLISS